MENYNRFSPLRERSRSRSLSRDTSPEINKTSSRLKSKTPVFELENLSIEYNSDKLSSYQTISDSTHLNSRQTNNMSKDNITFNFYNKMATNTTLNKLSKTAKNLILNLLEEIEVKHF
jgi:hypothetical protein